MLRDQRLQLGDEVGMASELELGVEQILAGGELQLLESLDLGRGEGLVGQVGERWPAPELERVMQLRCAFVGRLGLAGLGDELLEAREIELAGAQVQQVARAAGPDCGTRYGRAVGPRAERSRAARRAAPRIVDGQRLGCEGLVPMRGLMRVLRFLPLAGLFLAFAGGGVPPVGNAAPTFDPIVYTG